MSIPFSNNIKIIIMTISQFISTN
uniref:Uncharacterized protein n=1 Tax=Rhizophora mucronata TaxID=61149 RepID=A0A2P2Q065_RHIMU